MEGRITEIIREEKKGKVDTRNDKYKILTIYNLTDDVQENSTVVFDVAISARGYPYAKFKRVAERNQAIFNTEDRDRWYELGNNEELDFLKNVVPKTGLDIIINPEKTSAPWAIDLFDRTNNRYADLKTQNTPFFYCSQYKYNGKPYDPSYTVTFNRKDYEYYSSDYPECDIYFWVNWTQLEYKNIHVQPICGVWRASFSKMAELIQKNAVALHKYTHRANDDHNAKDSFLFSLSDESVFQRIVYPDKSV